MDEIMKYKTELDDGVVEFEVIKPNYLNAYTDERIALLEEQGEFLDLVDKDLDEQITNLFLTLGIPAHIKGYQYLREAVHMVLENHDVINRITKELYPGIARKFDTSASKVERAMRHAIEVAWSRGRLEAVNQMYGHRVFTREDKPTNGEFIAMISDKLAVRKTA